MKSPKFVLVGNQKGGVGKTTFTVLLASYYQYHKKYNVLVVDCDHTQWSINEMRRRELALLDKSDYYKIKATNQFRTTNKSVWPILKTGPVDALKDTLIYLEQHPGIDIVLFDLPGILSKEGIIYTISGMDYVVIPMMADKLVMESTLTYAYTIKQHLLDNDNTNLKSIHLFWTKIDKREKTHLYDQYEKVIGNFGIPILKTHVPNRARFKKELYPVSGPVYRSTIFLPDKDFLNDCKIKSLAEEILTIMEI